MPGSKVDAAGNGSARPGLGTFAGVVTPSLLTILGIILFLRLGYVVGQAGLSRALLILLLANAISVLTSLSLATIATNLRVKGGGDYYLISRTLGKEHGGALGLVLFLAQSVSIAFYAIGFGEAIFAIRPDLPTWTPQVVAGGAVLVLFVLAWLGADAATRFQYVVMVTLFAALVAFFVGGLRAFDPAVLAANSEPSGGLPFWTLFAIFFPAVTGFTQGVSMSGDLRDPGRSLPVGTFIAVFVSAAVYFGAAVVFAGAVPGSVLASDTGAMRLVSVVPWLVDAGVIAATLSSALASFLGAPRILQSLASDGIFPFLAPFAKGHGAARNPRRGVLLAALIAFVTVALGNLDLIAPIVSMFFLVSYGLLNYATYFEARSNSPSFRPTFRFFSPLLSLVGALGCAGAMLAISPVAGALALVLLSAVRLWIRRTVQRTSFVDGARSSRIQEIRERLHAVEAEPEHPRDWRPVVLAFSDDPARRERLLRFAEWIEGGSGFTTAVRIVEGRGRKARAQRAEAEAELRADIAERGLEAFTCVVAAEELSACLPVLLQSIGLGPIRPNTVLLNWFDGRPGEQGRPALRAYGEHLRTVLRYGCNVVVLAADTKGLAALERVPPAERRIDIWYRDTPTGRVSLLLAYLTTRSEPWKKARIRLLAWSASEEPPAQGLEELKAMLAEVRIDAEPEVITNADAAVVARTSEGASLVFLPFRVGDKGPDSPVGGALDDLVEGLPTTAFVLAARDLDLDADADEPAESQGA